MLERSEATTSGLKSSRTGISSFARPSVGGSTTSPSCQGSLGSSQGSSALPDSTWKSDPRGAVWPVFTGSIGVSFAAACVASVKLAAEQHCRRRIPARQGLLARTANGWPVELGLDLVAWWLTRASISPGARPHEELFRPDGFRDTRRHRTSQSRARDPGNRAARAPAGPRYHRWRQSRAGGRISRRFRASRSRRSGSFFKRSRD